MPKINQFPGTGVLSDTDILLVETSTGSNTRKIAYADFRLLIQNQSRSAFTTFFPHVSNAGVISWTNDGGKQNPEPVDLVAAVIAALPVSEGVSF